LVQGSQHPAIIPLAVPYEDTGRPRYATQLVPKHRSVIGDRPIDTVVAETIETLTNGLQPTPS
jgi:hypothetical protein